MIWEESVFYAAGEPGSRHLMDEGPNATTAPRPTGAAREDDGPIHGSTPPHGDILGDQVAGGGSPERVHSPEGEGPGAFSIGGVAGIGATGIGAAPGSELDEDAEERPLTRS